MLKKNAPAVPSEICDLPKEELAKAMAEEIAVGRILQKARSRQTTPVVMEKSIRDGEKFVARMRRASQAALLWRIKHGELITKEALILRLGGNSRWFTAAVTAERVFSLPATSGIEYFPSFFADVMYDRSALGKVAHALAGLPGPSKYYFFTTKSLSLGTTPLQALAEGRAKEVLRCAVGFSER